MYIWGGTSVLPMAEASMVDGNTVHGVAKSYSDNSTLTGANIVIYAGSSETTDITAEGKLKLKIPVRMSRLLEPCLMAKLI